MTRPVRNAIALLFLAACSGPVARVRETGASSEPLRVAAESLMTRLPRPATIVFAVSATERTIAPLTGHYGHLVLARQDRLECPSQRLASSGAQGYVVQVGLDSLVGDRAFVRWSIACRIGGQGYAEWVALELARDGVGWRTIREIYHFVT